MDGNLLQLDGRVEVRVFSGLLPNNFKIQERLDLCIQNAVSECMKVGDSLLEDLHQTIFLINLNLVYNSFHLRNALVRSFYFQQSNQMKSKTFDNEVCYQLSLTTKINESVKLYSVNDDTSNFAIVRVIHQGGELLSKYPSINALSENIVRSFTGEISSHEIPFTEMDNVLLTPEKKESVLKYFKFSPQEKQDSEPVNVIITKIAIKDNL